MRAAVSSEQSFREFFREAMEQKRKLLTEDKHELVQQVLWGVNAPADISATVRKEVEKYE